jgi:DNA-binding transcriptional regulator YiaG
MLQREVAEQIGVCEPSVFNWEANTSQPDCRYMPAIIEFLGYNPLPPGKTWAEWLVLRRATLGLSQAEAALRLGVDQSTLSGWERGAREPAGVYAKRAERFLADSESAFAPAAARTA